MKCKAILSLILSLFSSITLAQWKTVGQADYNWGPFLVYTMTLESENGQYKNQQLPLMLSFDYAKPVEGKNFAIILMKEMENQGVAKDQATEWLKELQAIFPDFVPNDHLSYIALPEQGYFVLNNNVLDHSFSPDFNQAFLSIWLAEKSSFGQVRNALLGKEKVKVSETHPKPLEQIQFEDDEINPQIPPNYKLQNQQKAFA